MRINNLKSIMNKCQVQNCGRVFESNSVLEQHIKRRHPKYFESQNRSEEGQVMQEEVNKLPKIKMLKMQSKQKKPVQIYRRSDSKGKNEQGVGLNTSKVTNVISESRTFMETVQNNSFKSGKRPSLSKRVSSGNLMDNRTDKLPEIKSIRPKKLQILGNLTKQSSGEQRDVMSSTAPNFKNLIKKDISVRQRSGSKQKTKLLRQEQQTSKPNTPDELIFVKTQTSFHEKQTKLHRPLKKIIQKIKEKEKIQSQTQNTSQIIEKEQPKIVQKPTDKIQIKRSSDIRHQLKMKPKRDGSIKKGQIKLELSEMYDFKQKIIVFKSNVAPRLVIPIKAAIEYLYANSCNLMSINLNGLETLRQISVQYNQLKQLSFLNYQNNHNIQRIFADHNLLTSLDYLPPNLRVLSVTFNQISGLDFAARQINRLESLQQVDFTFTPIRKEPNYKLHIISACSKLKKIDGIKLTKFDWELAKEYAKIMDQSQGLIPSNKLDYLVVSKCSNSPSTVISGESQSDNISMTHEELQSQIKSLKKVIKQTTNNLDIIRQQNIIISGQIHDLQTKTNEVGADPSQLYDKLKRQCQALQLLNFLQYCSQQQLMELIQKKEHGQE